MHIPFLWIYYSNPINWWNTLGLDCWQQRLLTIIKAHLSLSLSLSLISNITFFPQFEKQRTKAQNQTLPSLTCYKFQVVSDLLPSLTNTQHLWSGELFLTWAQSSNTTRWERSSLQSSQQWHRWPSVSLKHISRSGNGTLQTLAE